ncbi:MAG: hypothetical protein AB7T49_15875 [Oligoflexales bacterium]
MRRSPLYYAILASYVIAGCGPKEGNEKRVTFPQFTDDPPWTHYSSINPGCGLPDALETIDRVQIHQIQRTAGGFQLAETVPTLPETDLWQGNPLRSQLVSRVTVGGVFKRQCTSPTPNCQTKSGVPAWKMTEPPRNLFLCEEPISLERDSYESVGASSLFNLSKVLANAERLSGTAPPSLKLEIIPHYISSFLRKDEHGAKIWKNGYITHNLAYFPDLKKIAVFPESANGQEFFNEYGHLWESDFPIAHEVGHHIEQTILEKTGGPVSGALTWEPQSHVYVLADGLASTFTGTVSTADVLTAVSESFADIMGFLLIDENESSVNAVFGLESRNPVLPTLRLGDSDVEKVLDETNYRHYTEDLGPFRMTNHDMGAIIAYGINDVISKAAESLAKQTKTRGEWKYFLATKWLEYSLDGYRSSISSETLRNENLFLPIALAWDRVWNDAQRELPLGSELDVDIIGHSCIIFKENWPLIANRIALCE